MNNTANASSTTANFSREEDLILRTVYHGMMLPLVAMAIMPVISLLVLRRPALRLLQVNRYFEVLAWSDLLVFVAYLPIFWTLGPCSLMSYGWALYYRYLGFNVTHFFDSVSTFILLLLSLDRFMAVWLPNRYARLQNQQHYMRNRLILTLVFCTAVHLPFSINGTEPKFCNATKKYYVEYGMEDDNEKVWHTVYRHCFFSVMRWMPALLLLVFNSSMVVAVVRGRIRFPGKDKDSMDKEIYLVLTMILMAACYILFSMPITIYLSFFYKDSGRCRESEPEVKLRVASNLLVVLEHAFHPIFLASLNRSFRREMRAMLGRRVEEQTDQRVGAAAVTHIIQC